MPAFNNAHESLYEVIGKLSKSDIPMRRAFALHLAKVQEALRIIEKVDDADYPQGAERHAMIEVFMDDLDRNQIEITRQHLEEAAKIMADLLDSPAFKK